MHVTLRVGDDTFDLYLVREGGKVKVEVDGETYEADVRKDNGTIRVEVGGETFDIGVGDEEVVVDGETLPLELTNFQAAGAPGDHGKGSRGHGAIRPPMPGKIVDVRVQPGDEVQAGQVLVILEAMKMQNEIGSPGAGVVKAVHVKVGQSVEAKDLLVELE